jgi:hypothetical protein
MKLPSLRNRRAVTNVEEMAIVILVFAVTAIIAVLTYAKLFEALPKFVYNTSSVYALANTTVIGYNTSFYSSIQLLGVTLIVMAAVSVIGVIMWLRSR